MLKNIKGCVKKTYIWLQTEHTILFTMPIILTHTWRDFLLASKKPSQIINAIVSTMSSDKTFQNQIRLLHSFFKKKTLKKNQRPRLLWRRIQSDVYQSKRVRWWVWWRTQVSWTYNGQSISKKLSASSLGASYGEDVPKDQLDCGVYENTRTSWFGHV